MKVYLCGPINGRSDDDCKTWREQVKTSLKDFCDPMDRDYRGRELEPGIATEIVEKDKQDIRSCDVLLVYYDKPSVGTSMEILYAHNLALHIVLIDRSSSPLSPWLIYHSSKIVKTLDEALQWLESMSARNEQQRLAMIPDGEPTDINPDYVASTPGTRDRFGRRVLTMDERKGLYTGTVSE